MTLRTATGSVLRRANASWRLRLAARRVRGAKSSTLKGPCKSYDTSTYGLYVRRVYGTKDSSRSRGESNIIATATTSGMRPCRRATSLHDSNSSHNSSTLRYFMLLLLQSRSHEMRNEGRYGGVISHRRPHPSWGRLRLPGLRPTLATSPP